MTIRHVLLMGHPLLLEVSQPVQQFSTPELNILVEDMMDTMAEKEGAGLAAPQIGVLLRVAVFGIESSNPRYPNRGHIPMTVLINPKIEPLGEEIENDWEGCLSVPGMSGVVPRYKKILYRGYDIQGTPYQVEAEGFHARVVQHECDHIDGILYPRRIVDMRQFGFNEQLANRNGC